MKKTIKKFLSFLIVAILLSTLGFFPSLATVTNKNLFDATWIGENIVPYVQPMDWVLNETEAYILFPTRIYRYTLGEEEPVLLSDLLPGIEEEELFFQSQDQALEKLGEKSNRLFHQLFMWNNELYGLNTLTGVAILVNQENGELNFEKKIILNWEKEDLTKALEDEEFVKILVMGCEEDKLFIKYDFYSNNPQTTLSSFTLPTGERKDYATRNIHGLFSFEEGKLLALVHGVV